MIINPVIAFSTTANKGSHFPRGYIAVIMASTATGFLIRSVNSGRQDIYFAFFSILMVPGGFLLLDACHYSYTFFSPSGLLNGVMNFKLLI